MSRLDEPTTVRLYPEQNQQIKELAVKTGLSETAVRRHLITTRLHNMPKIDSDEFWPWWESLGAPF